MSQHGIHEMEHANSDEMDALLSLKFFLFFFRYITTFQVQVIAPVNVTATERLIFELLTKGYTNATVSISVPSGEISISHISTVWFWPYTEIKELFMESKYVCGLSMLFIVTDPGLCPEETMLTVYGIYMWPEMTPQNEYSMGCVRGNEFATRFW